MRAVAAMVFVVGMALLVLLLVRARPGPDPFDPRSGQPSGARGLVLTLQAAGATVTDTKEVPLPSEETRVLVLEDRLNDQQRQELLDFVQAGGVAIVADPGSSLHGGSDVDGGAIEVSGRIAVRAQRAAATDDSNVSPGRCTISALTDLRGVFVPDGVLFPVGPGEPTCFTRDEGSHSFVIVRNFGEGLIVGLGDNELLTNRHLRRADNSGLAVAALVPERNSNVTFLLGRDANPTVSDVGSGDETLRDLVPAWVWMSLALGAVAFVVFAGSRSARVGRLVTEPIAAPIAGSELVSATGNLMDRAGHAERAGWLLRDHLHRDLCRSHGVDLRAPVDELDRVVALRSGTQPGRVASLLRTGVSGKERLVEFAAAVDGLRQDVFGPGGSNTTDDRHEHSSHRPDERVPS